MSIEEFEASTLKDILASGHVPPPETKQDAKALRRAGVRFFSKGLIWRVKLPKGWEATQTEFRWAELRDSEGVVRAKMFWKYSGGHLAATTRYSLHRPRGLGCQARDHSTGEIIFAPDVAERDAERAVIKWLDETYPDWRDPSKYWDDARPWWKFWK